jgi:DNA polymerase-3 subunit delta
MGERARAASRAMARAPTAAKNRALEAAAQALREREKTLLAARQEDEKLSLLLPPGEVSLDALREAVTDVSRFERDALVEAIHGGDAGHIVKVVASLEAGGEPLPLLLWVLTEELRLMMAMALGQRPRRYLAPQRAAAVQKTARRHTAASFQRELLRAHRIDRMIKGIETGDPWSSVIDMALGLAGKPILVEAA